jgi:hypothetical protein
MSQLLLAPRSSAPARRNFAEQQPDRSAVTRGRRLTLDERISKVWEGILAAGTADCPVCRGPMERMGDSGRCIRCHSTLT